MFVISMIASLLAFSALLLQNEDDLDAVILVEAALESEDALNASARTKCPLWSLSGLLFGGCNEV